MADKTVRTIAKRPTRREMLAERSISGLQDGFINNGVIPGRQAGLEKTSRATRNIQVTEEMSAMLSTMNTEGLTDEISDEEAMANAMDGPGTEFEVPEPVNSHNLPAVISKELSTNPHVVPEWHMVRHLPGYVQEPIRALGRRIFKEITQTPIEELQTMTTLMNDEAEVRLVMSWIQENGVRKSRSEVTLEGIFDGYRSDAQVWEAKGCCFLLVHDFAGYYIYGWPSADNLELDHHPTPRLPGR